MSSSASCRITGDLWRYASTFFPSDLDDLAFRTGAILRPRKVQEAEQLLRAFLLYASTGSFRTTAELARASGLADLSSEGLFYRLSRSEEFLSSVLAHLVERCAGAPVGFRLLVVDATAVCGPGATGTDWRVHVVYDPLRGVPCSVRATDRSVGESLSLHSLEPGQLVLGDRGYGNARNVDAALRAGADVLMRVQVRAMRLLVPETGERADWEQMEKQVPLTGTLTFELKLPVPPEGSTRGSWKTSDAARVYDVRLVGARNKDREVVWLATNLPETRLSAAKACDLYRVRWQVELYFKRLKSLGDLGVLGSRDGPTAKAALLAKLVLLVLTNLLCHEEQAFSPYGYDIPKEPLERIPPRPQKTRLRPASQKSQSQKNPLPA